MSEKEKVIEAMFGKQKRYIAFLVVFSVLSLVMLYAWYIQLTQGLFVTSLNRPVYWGLYISNFVFLAATAASGIAVSASVRLLGLKKFKTAARVGEMLTIAALIAAAFNIIFDLGRPDRAIINLFIYGRYTSPFIWDLTVLTTYFFGTLVYFFVSIRPDVYEMSKHAKGFRAKFYSLLLLGYNDSIESLALHNRIARIMTIAILPILVTFHSVLGYVFGLQVSVAGWHSTLMAPSFIVAAVGTGLAIIILISAFIKNLMRLKESIDNSVFLGLGKALMLFMLAEIYFTVSESLTALYAGPIEEREAFQELIFGADMPIFWSMAIPGMVVPVLLLAIANFTRIKDNTKKLLGITIVASMLALAGLWIKRFLLVAPLLGITRLPIEEVHYTPTPIEWALVVGSYGVAGLVFMFLAKMIPIVEIRDIEEHKERVKGKKSLAFTALAIGIILAGVGVYAMLVSEPEPGVRSAYEIIGGPIMLLSGIILSLLSPAIYIITSREIKLKIT